MSTFKECPDYDSHFCALENIFLYLSRKGLECIRNDKETYFDSYFEVRDEVSYADNLGVIQHTFVDDERDRTLLTLGYEFISSYVTVYREKLIYEPKDLISWIGGAIGIFVGYSVFDLSNQIIDVIFNCIARLTTTVV